MIGGHQSVAVIDFERGGLPHTRMRARRARQLGHEGSVRKKTAEWPQQSERNEEELRTAREAEEEEEAAAEVARWWRGVVVVVDPSAPLAIAAALIAAHLAPPYRNARSMGRPHEWEAK